MDNLFVHPKALLERAKRHLDEMESKSNAFFDDDAYKFVDQRDRANPQAIRHKVKFTKALDPQLFCIAFDAVNCLRSSLDHAVYASARDLTNDDDPDHTKFPFADDAAGSVSQFKRGGSGVPHEIRPHLLSLEPYKDGKGHVLWALNKVRNGKIHRMLSPMAYAPKNTGFGPGPTGSLYIEKLSVCAEWNADRTELTYARSIGCKGSVRFGLVFAIAFTDDRFFAPKPAVHLLREVAEKIEAIICGIEAETTRVITSRRG